MSQLVLAERYAKKGAKCFDEGDNECRGRAETRACWRINRGGDCRRDCLSAVVVVHHAFVDPAVQQESGLRQFGRGREDLFTSQILSPEYNAVVVAWADESIGEAVDCGVENSAIKFVAIGREVSAAPGQAEAQGSARACHDAKIERQRFHSILGGI